MNVSVQPPDHANMIRIIALAALLLLFALPAARAHDFWIMPQKFAPQPGEAVPVTLHIGQNFSADSYPRIADWIRRFELIDAKGARKIAGVDGDDPAGIATPREAGTQLIIFHSKPEDTLFTNWKKFLAYLKEEGNEAIAAAHLAAGGSKTEIREAYTRCAKSLLRVGAGGKDRLVGMPLELVAEQSPAALSGQGGLDVRLYYRGQPLAGKMLKIFSQSDRVKPLRLITDGNGRARIPLAHKGAYLVNAVHVVEPEAGSGMDWQSFWASLTFEKP